MSSNNPTQSTSHREIISTRVFDATRERVFKAWTDPGHLAQWWGPRGVWRFVMHGPDGRDYKNKIVYIEVARPERLVYRHAGDEDTEPVNFHVTVTFAERGGKTELTVRMVFPSAGERERVVREYGADEGLNQTLERLEEHLTFQRGGNR